MTTETTEHPDDVSAPTAVTAVLAQDNTAPAPPARTTASPFRPLRVLGAIAQLAALGALGWVIFVTVVVLLSLGLALLPILGIGAIFLLGLVYALYAFAWLETSRVEGLYTLGIPPLAPRSARHPGFGGFLAMVGRQFIDGSMWKALAHLTIACILGTIVLPLVTLAVSGIFVIFTPLFQAQTSGALLWGTSINIDSGWAPLIGILLTAVALAAVVGIALLHGLLSRLMLVPSREAQLALQAQTSDAQRVGAIRASEVERTRIERDLHDGVQPRLVSIAMTLGLAQQKIDGDPETAKTLVAEAHTSTKAAITDLRQLARGIHASVLDDRGLDAALSALAGRSHIPVNLDVRMDGRCGTTAETAVYFAVAETLTNAAKHSRASECRVVVRRRDDLLDDGTTQTMLWARVDDNGIGGAQVIAGGGLDGIANRVAAAGGTMRLDSPTGGPTSLEVSVPCVS